MSFKLTTIKNTRDVRSVGRSSLATTTGSLYFNALSGGALQLAVAATTANQVLYVSNETLASGSTPVSMTVCSKEDEYLVDTDNNSNASHNGQRMVIGAGGATLTNTGTDVTGTTGVFVQLAVVGAASDKKILARRV